MRATFKQMTYLFPPPGGGIGRSPKSVIQGNLFGHSFHMILVLTNTTLLGVLQTLYSTNIGCLAGEIKLGICLF